MLSCALMASRTGNIDFVVVSFVDVVDRCFAKPGATETRNDDDVGYVATCRLL